MSTQPAVKSECHHPAYTPATHEEVGRLIGWDFARAGMALPDALLLTDSPLRAGWEMGREALMMRQGSHPRLSLDRWARKLLVLRANAWQRGRNVDLDAKMGLTPDYLKALDPGRCPITNEVLTAGLGLPTDASVDRVLNEAGYARGNLIIMSARANWAKGALGLREIDEVVEHLQSGRAHEHEGLGLRSWQRLATLVAWVTPLTNAEASRRPLYNLGAQGLCCLNPPMALKALALIACFGGTGLDKAFRSRLPTNGLKRAFDRLVESVEPCSRGVDSNIDDARAAINLGELLGAASERSLVAQRWIQLWSLLEKTQYQGLLTSVCAASRHGLIFPVIKRIQDVRDAWALPNRGFVEGGGKPLMRVV